MGLTDGWDPGFGDFLQKLYQYHHKNPDHNSGNPLGVSVCQVSAFNGQRTTASGAYLSTIPPNLTVRTDTIVRKILFQDIKAIGIELLEQKSQRNSSTLISKAKVKLVYARKEVMISAGAINSPKLLLLSGIGSTEELQCHDIPVIQEVCTALK